MVQWFLDHKSLSAGVHRLILAYVLVAAYAAIIAFATTYIFAGSSWSIQTPMIWNMAAGALGGLFALRLTLNWFGHPSLRGAGWAISGGIILTILASVAAGTLMEPGFGTMNAFPAVLVTFWKLQFVLVFWCVALFGCHLMVGKWRQERETVFHMPENPLPI